MWKEPSHPDLAVELLAKQTRADLVVEVYLNYYRVDFGAETHVRSLKPSSTEDQNLRLTAFRADWRGIEVPRHISAGGLSRKYYDVSMEDAGEFAQAQQLSSSNCEKFTDL